MAADSGPASEVTVSTYSSAVAKVETVGTSATDGVGEAGVEHRALEHGCLGEREQTAGAGGRAARDDAADLRGHADVHDPGVVLRRRPDGDGDASAGHENATGFAQHGGGVVDEHQPHAHDHRIERRAGEAGVDGVQLGHLDVVDAGQGVAEERDHARRRRRWR